MELWIRSQNKGGLIKAEILGNTEGIIHAYSGVNKTVLGTYKSNERAVEVLDEIQNLLKQEEMLHINKSLLNDLDDIEEPKYILRPVYQPRVYEMPEE